MRPARSPYLEIFRRRYSRRMRALSILGHGVMSYKPPLLRAILRSAEHGKVGPFSRAARLVPVCLGPFSCLGRVTPTASKDLPITCGRMRHVHASPSKQHVGVSLSTPMLLAEITGLRKSKRS